MLNLEVGDPLTAEELEEKEQLLEEVSKFLYKPGFVTGLFIFVLILLFGELRDFHHGAGRILILLLGPVKSMAEMILKVLLLRWKEKQKRKLKDMRKSSKKDTRN